MPGLQMNILQNHWASNYPHTQLMCSSSLDFMIKAKLKLQSENLKIQYGCQTISLKVTLLKFNRLLSIYTSNLLLKFGIYIKIPEFTCPISHNAPFRTEMCTFLFWMVHLGCGTGALWDLSIWSIVMSAWANTSLFYAILNTCQMLSYFHMYIQVWIQTPAYTISITIYCHWILQ